MAFAIGYNVKQANELMDKVADAYKNLGIYTKDQKNITGFYSSAVRTYTGKIDPNQKMVALTFDDGPSDGVTPSISVFVISGFFKVIDLLFTKFGFVAISRLYPEQLSTFFHATTAHAFFVTY